MLKTLIPLLILLLACQPATSTSTSAVLLPRGGDYPATLGAVEHNLQIGVPYDEYSMLSLTPASGGSTLTGIATDAPDYAWQGLSAGAGLWLRNMSGVDSITLTHLDVNSSFSYQFSTPGGAPYVLAPRGVVQLYLVSDPAWLLLP